MSAVCSVITFRLFAAAVALTLLTVAVPAPAEAAFPGENGRLVFVASDSDGNYGIFTSTASGEDRTRLTASYYSAEPSWSPDGRRIAYLTESGHIWTMKADGSDKKRVTAKANWQRRRPVFSPSGNRIMYSQFGSGTGKDRLIFTVKLDGSDRRRIGGDLPGGGGVMNGVYSPNGERVAFEYWRRGDDNPYASGIYTMRLDGTGLRRITGPDNEDRAPSWSPDGKRLVFERENGRGVAIHAIDADGTGRDQLASFSRANAKDPVWSPDGRFVAFVKETAANDTVWTMRPNGSDKTLVLDGPGHDQQVNWQPR